MTQKLPAIDSQELLRILKVLGFGIIRTKGSHVRLRSEDGRVTTVPIHSNKEIPKGLLRKIIREDLEMSLDDFLELYSDTKRK
ncbi:MAG TPA: type II toxin-antitoxin system HicA family toxin [Methanothrix sp.]|nr:type II toxin-antitoxin system HicA family toxin [Methanothrix sp.]